MEREGAEGGEARGKEKGKEMEGKGEASPLL